MNEIVQRPAPTRWRQRVLVAGVLSAMAGLIGPQPAAAQSRASLPPVPGQWCGLADGGVVRLTVSTDGRFVESIAVDTDRGSLSSAEGTVVVARAQIADDKFIFRGGDASRDRCEPTRCTGPGCLPGASGRDRPGAGRGSCTDYPTTGIMLRGTFLQPDYVRGTYTGQITTVLRPANTRGGTGSGAVTSSRRIVGNYVAWPAGTAPCP
ncbi:MAG: hypothetical protein DYG90_13705 [Chloroflexi bacterium CFX6]|nr:hypothetical protein [Chloroflexi bacterium CFX6]